MQQSLILQCSPRSGGNSQTLATLAATIVGGEIKHLASQNIAPCTSCGFCQQHPGQCSLGLPPLFQDMFQAKVTLFIAPIYFYHLPAQAKAFIDRAQAWWHTDSKPGRGNVLVPMLLAGRSQGQQLFRGSMLTLGYFAKNLGMELAPALLLPGLDGPGDFTAQPQAQAQACQYIQDLNQV